MPSRPQATTGETLVVCRNVRHRYRGGVEALRGVSLDVRAGEVVALVGPNGSGKSTLMSILSTRLRPESESNQTGTVAVAGACPWTDAPTVRRALAVVFQHPAVDDKLTAAENLRCHARLYGASRALVRVCVEAGLRDAGLTDRANDRVEEFSGGMRRRLEIAKAAMTAPRVLLLDEPDAGLDPGALRAVWDQVTALRAERGVAVLLATHRMELASRCDRVAVLHAGELKAFGTPGELRAMVPGGVVRVEVDGEESAAVAERITSLRDQWPGGAEPRVAGEGVVVYDDRPADLAQGIHGMLGDSVSRISFGRATLEDVFFALTAATLDGDAP